jgi:acyl-coenzyme A thioesterase PaaI-like protein
MHRVQEPGERLPPGERRSTVSGTASQGWQTLAVKCPFGQLIGPVQRRRAGDGWVYGMTAHDQLANEAGIVHGGAITALFDEMIGSLVNEELGRAHITVQFSTVFLRPINIGDFIEFAHEIVEATRSMTFVESRLIVGGKVVAKADMIFRVRQSGPA